jgi:hypothetical protein
MPLAPWLKLPCNISALTVILSAVFNAQAQQPLFPVTGFYNPGATVTTFLSGDFNNDGQPDIAFTSPAASGGPQFASITVLLNRPVTPTPVVTPLNCASAPQLIAADLNNDKKLDLVATCTEGDVVVLLGNGDGSFQKPFYYTTSGTPVIAQPVDLNGDGYLDVAAATPSAVLVMLNQGATAPGTLLAAKSYTPPTGMVFSGIQSGDFNGDGKQDILAISTNRPTMDLPFALFYGNGDGTLQPPQTPTEISISGPAVAADFNHDGITDIAYLSTGSPTGAPQSVQILQGSPSGLFVNNAAISLNGFTKYASLVYAGSTNGGKNVNLAIVGSNTEILRGDTNGVFTAGPAYAINGTPFPQTASDGTTSLLFLTANGFSLLKGTSDGTFQGLPNLQVGHQGFFAGDINGDGLTDILTLNAPVVDNVIDVVAAIGRGNGTFLVTHQTPVNAGSNPIFITGDFTSDGKIDAVLIQPGGQPPLQAEGYISILPGNGDGSFQSPLAPTNLLISGATNAITGDFNGDGKLDIVIAFAQNTNANGLLFVPGNGNGTFGAPVPFAPPPSSPTGPPLSADLNNDKHLDLVWNNAVYLNNGDGTFHQLPLALSGTPLAVGDLDGDGIPDIVIQPPTIAGVTPPPVIYSGNGDGTFHTTSLYTTTTLPPSTTVSSAVIGDVNADGHPDLILQYQTPTSASISVYLGDGKGTFTPDSNTYFAGASIQTAPTTSAPTAVLTRLNNQAPALSADGALDYLTFTSGGATSLLNQTNPTPSAPQPFPTTTTLSSNPTTAAPTQPIAFTGHVTGITPSGTVTFTSGGTALGTASILTTAGATVSAAFPSAGTYTVSAAYAGDSNNQPSTSNPVTVTIAKVPSSGTIFADTPAIGANLVFRFLVSLTGYAPTGSVTVFLADGTTLGMGQATNGQATIAYAFPIAGTYTVYASYAGDAANLPSTTPNFTLTVNPQDFTFSASGNQATISAGQAVGGTLTIAPTYGFSGTVKFSCSPLLTGEACSFNPSTVRSLNGFSSVTTTVVISTTAPTASRLRKLFGPFEGITWTGLFGLILFRRRLRTANLSPILRSLLALLLAAGLLQIAACSSSSPSSNAPPTQNNGTPKGTQAIVITAADSSGTPSHTVTIQLTVD